MLMMWICRVVAFWWIGKLIFERRRMRFDIVTLFPELFAPLLTSGITRRAYESGQVEVKFSNPRDFAEGNYRRVDDRPFGGGPGMVMMAEPLTQSILHIQAERPTPAPVVLFSPVGRRLDHAMVTRWAESQGAILICGRYEGLDQRFIDEQVTEQIRGGVQPLRK
jgi:tRNA (guanine37-N1)-methyltransferase